MQMTLKGSFAYVYFICLGFTLFYTAFSASEGHHAGVGKKKGILDEGCANINQLHYSIGGGK